MINIKEQLDKAIKLHSENKIDEAEEIYSVLYKYAPDNVNVLNLYGLLEISKKNYNFARELLSKALILNNSPYIITNFAKSYVFEGNYSQAVKFLENTDSAKFDDEMYYTLAIAHKSLKNYDKAVDAYKKAVEINSKNYNAIYNLIILYKEIGDYQNAINLANYGLCTFPESEEIYAVLSDIYEKSGNTDYAIKSLNEAVKINGGKYVYYYNLGVLYSKINDIESAVRNYEEVLKLNPNHIETLVNLCSVYKSINKQISLEYIKKAFELSKNNENIVLNYAQIERDLYNNEKSIEIINNYLNINSDCAEAYSLLGVNYMDMGLYDKALEAYNKAVNLNPDNPNYLHSKAMALKYLGKYSEALNILENVVLNHPEIIQSSISLGMMYLQNKDFYKGMELYIKRSNDTNFSKIFTQKLWDINTDLKDKNVLIYSDCGLGDTIMYLRYLPRVKQLNKNVTLKTDKEIVNIIKNSFRDINVISKSQEFSDYDVVIPIMNVPYAIKSDFNSIPMAEGYLTDDKKLTDSYSKLEIFKTDKIKAGIFRQGNKRIFKNRSVPVEYIEQITSSDKFQFYSFQKEDSVIKNTIPLSEYINDYTDTLSLLKNIDLLITIDSSIAHAAGALGVKTYLMLPYTAEWRWFNDTETTPWYNSIKLFRQNKISDWREVTDRIIGELSKL